MKTKIMLFALMVFSTLLLTTSVTANDHPSVSNETENFISVDEVNTSIYIFAASEASLEVETFTFESSFTATNKNKENYFVRVITPKPNVYVLEDPGRFSKKFIYTLRNTLLRENSDSKYRLFSRTDHVPSPTQSKFYVSLTRPLIL